MWRELSFDSDTDLLKMLVVLTRAVATWMQKVTHLEPVIPIFFARSIATTSGSAGAKQIEKSEMRVPVNLE